MKIDKEKFPALFDDDIVIRRFKQDVPNPVIDNYYEIISKAKKNLFYVASTIMEPIEQSFQKLLPFREELPDVVRGILFMVKGRPHCVFYMISNLDDRIMLMGQISAVYDGDHLGDIFAGYMPKGTSDTKFHQYNGVGGNIDRLSQPLIKIILASELFINFAEIERREVQPSRQIWDGPTCLYNNKTKSPITIVDSTWYTNLISSGAFKVRGHLRLQPYGEGREKRKLIWINDFEKEGYTRKAKIESTDKPPTNDTP